ncbi:MAG: secretin N-terminal domain-containing protein [Bdellovibrionota bacterium]
MKSIYRFAFFSFIFLTASTFLIAQTELMDDVDAIKENSDEDLYAPDDEATGSNSEAPSSEASIAAPTSRAAQSDLLEDLPVAGEGARPDEALTGTDASSAELSSIRIYSLADRTRFEIQTSKVVDYVPEKSSKAKQFSLNLANTNLGPLLSKGPINASEYGGPVSKVQAYESKSANGTNARIVMNMSSMAEPSIRREGNRILVDFFNKGVASNNQSNGKDIPENFETLISLNGKQNFVGTKVNFRAKEATIPDVLQFISQVSGKNFVLVGEVDRKISINVKRVPWDQVLALVLLNAELGYQKMGNTYRVMPVTKIRQEIADSIKAQEDEDKLAPKATELFPLSYAKTTEVIPQITKYLKSDYGENVVSDERTNSIVVTALPKNIQRIQRYISAIDRQTPVVLIEARIVQANKTFSRDIGIDWKALGGIKFAGGTLSIGSALGSPASTTTGSTGSSSSAASTSSSPFNSLGQTGGAFGQYLNPTGTLQQLDAFIKFNEAKSNTRELARPSLTVLNNKKQVS